MWKRFGRQGHESRNGLEPLRQFPIELYWKCNAWVIGYSDWFPRWEKANAARKGGRIGIVQVGLCFLLP
jgi:hypothetical protein